MDSGESSSFLTTRLLDDTDDLSVSLYFSCSVLDGWLGISVAPLETESRG